LSLTLLASFKRRQGRSTAGLSIGRCPHGSLMVVCAAYRGEFQNLFPPETEMPRPDGPPLRSPTSAATAIARPLVMRNVPGNRAAAVSRNRAHQALFHHTRGFLLTRDKHFQRVITCKLYLALPIKNGAMLPRMPRVNTRDLRETAARRQISRLPLLDGADKPVIKPMVDFIVLPKTARITSCIKSLTTTNVESAPRSPPSKPSKPTGRNSPRPNPDRRGFGSDGGGARPLMPFVAAVLVILD
jgi:hypothetical protein